MKMFWACHIVYMGDIRWEFVDWIHLALGRDQWCAFVIMVLNLHIPYNVGHLLTS